MPKVKENEIKNPNSLAQTFSNTTSFFSDPDYNMINIVL